MSSLIFNEGYKGSNLIFDKGVGSKIYLKKKSFIDLSNCAGSLLLGHNSKIFQRKIDLMNYLSTFVFNSPKCRNILKKFMKKEGLVFKKIKTTLNKWTN